MLVNGNIVRDAQHVAAAAEADSKLDELLYNQESGVEIALHRAQLWSKFAKDLISFIDKRTNICELRDFKRSSLLHTLLIDSFDVILFSVQCIK